MAAKKERLSTVKPSGEKDGSGTAMIYDLVRQIPKGRVSTYGAIAKVLNVPNPRMVGKAMGLMPADKKPYPAHRVINSSGHLSGDHQETRKQLLEKEGIKVNGTKIVDFRTLFWDPAEEL